MKNSVVDVIVIGAGQAGLGTSYYLKQAGLKHFVFEHNKIGNTWRTQRWDSFKLNTPNHFNLLPGMKESRSDRDGFCSASEFVGALESYVAENELPVVENATVVSVEKSSGSDLFNIAVSQNGKENTYYSKEVVIASGSQNKKDFPGFVSKFSPTVKQLHASEYRNAGQLPKGSVLVVGSGQSGAQITEDLLDAGRKVYLSTSKVARAPRRYRGKDFIEWLKLSGMIDQRPEDLPDPNMMEMRQPLISGVGPRGKSLSLQGLAKKGAVILGKMVDAGEDIIRLQSNAAEHVKFADAFYRQIKNTVDEIIIKAGFDAPPPEADEADLPDENAACVSNETSLNLKKHNITSVIWATGFKGDFGYLNLPVSEKDGTIKHKNGLTEISGLYILGIPWLRKRKSGLVCGIEEDAKFIIRKLNKHNSAMTDARA